MPMEIRIYLPEYERMMSGWQTFYIQNMNDYDQIQKDDQIIFRECKYGFQGVSPTKRKFTAKVTYVTSMYQKENHIVFGFIKVDE